MILIRLFIFKFEIIVNKIFKKDNGRTLMNKRLKISSFCSPFLFTVDENMGLPEVMELMNEANIRHIPVVKDDKPIGIISDRDLKVFEEREFADKFTAGDLMNRDIFKVNSESDLREVVETMTSKKFGSCLVTGQNGNIEGIFTTIDALRTLGILLDPEKSPPELRLP